MRNPFTKERLQGAGVAVFAGLALWASGYVVTGSGAERDAKARADQAVVALEAPRCVAAYLGAPDRTVEQVKKMKAASNSTQSTELQKDGFASSEVVALACGKAIDALSEQQVAEGMKKPKATVATK